MQSIWLVVMGVSGCGKSSLGQALAVDLGLPLIEGDDFHPEANIAKMRAGTPLTDDDRAGWLARLGDELAARPAGAVLTCSSLKRAYRDRLRAAVPGLRFAFMEISRDEAQARVEARAGAHIFPGSLVANQFATLESPTGEEGVVTVQAVAPIDRLTAEVRHWLGDDARCADRGAE
ncbi:gluconokinase [Variovorax ginsengisoli]|uniref:Gluconokinase n=1 Tax=Variovorax ginsengisoli TaxID=363844 RepID=A0ABT9S675_9BURK|nr:gluconokinase [Variovorax ginsengisoli]MDP9899358.1 gluconokinase [Variovorax ginsengisoli]